MKAKIIKLVLRNKFDAFCNSITDETLRSRVRQGSIITGGSICSLLTNEPVNDYDIYFRTFELTRDVARHFVDQFKSDPPKSWEGMKITVEHGENRVSIKVQSAGVAGDMPEEGDDEHDMTQQAMANVEDGDDIPMPPKEKEEKPKYRPRFLSSNAITLTDGIQLVIRFFGEPDQIHENYDFVHCTNYWKSWDNELVLRPAALEAILARELRYVGSKYPICSVIRARKFIKRGWHINAGQLLKMAWQISKLNLENVRVLEEQLVGVDAAYFRILIDALQKNNAERVDENHLMSIIDKVF